MNIEIANRLVELRKKSGLSQEELAAKLGLSRQAVSKWERAEASPDTDNLVCLAKLYGVSLDDLLDTDQSVDDIARNAKEQQSEAGPKAGSEAKASTSEEANPKEQEKATSSSSGTIHLEDGSDKVDIDLSGLNININNEKKGAFSSGSSDKKSSTVIDETGIHTTSENGKRVDIDDSGIHISKDGQTTTVVGNGEYHMKKKQSAFDIVRDVLSGTICVLCLAAYLLMGFLWTDQNAGWIIGWTVFFLVPLVPGVFEAIKKKRFCEFPYPVLVTGVYVFLGLYGNYIGKNYWHPWWILFLSIPLYYVLFATVDKLIHGGQEITVHYHGDKNTMEDDDDLEDLKDDVDDAQDDVNEANEDLAEAQSDLKDAETALKEAEDEKDLGPADHNEEVANAKDERDDAQDEVDAATQELEHAKRRLERAKARYAAHAEKPKEAQKDNVSTAGAVNVEATDKKDEKKE
ncbi:MAG: HTH-type transcriptional regulator ImmR [Tenericutes bacterium ADurb.BinA155]|nr:MAG: HTH-type transcriptional regulator ImmR [Tenericutes bacterium ADurb.BinA155]